MEIVTTEGKLILEGQFENAREMVKYALMNKVSLREADLSGMDLTGVIFADRDLSWADFGGSNLETSNFYHTNLACASFYLSNLKNADFSYANLTGAKFSRAKVAGVSWPAPTMVLLANWEGVTYQLCADLMLYDSTNHPHPERFDDWKESEKHVCPYQGEGIQRSANFLEKRDLWGTGEEQTAYQLMMRLIQEKCSLA
jgi:hypothetical protein